MNPSVNWNYIKAGEIALWYLRAKCCEYYHLWLDMFKTYLNQFQLTCTERRKKNQPDRFQVTLGWIDRWLGIYKIKVRNLRYYFSRLLRLPRSCCPRLYQICYSPPWLLRPLRLCWQHLLHPQCCLQWKINNVKHFFQIAMNMLTRSKP